MKQSDIAALVLVSVISIVVAYFVANALIGKPSSSSVTVKTIQPISATITQPDPSIFNKNAINPTVKVIIGTDSTSNTKGS